MTFSCSVYRPVIPLSTQNRFDLSCWSPDEIMRLFLHGCTSYLDTRSSVVLRVNFFGHFSSLLKLSLILPDSIVQYFFIYFALTRFNSRHCVQYYLASFLALGCGRSFRSSPPFSRLLVIVLLMKEGDERRTRGPDRAWIKRRREKGAFQNIVKELVDEDLPSFNNFMRMDCMTFQALVENISHKITKRTTMMRKAISASERVALTLGFLATGKSFSSLEYQFRISKRAILNIVFEICSAIYSEMGNSCLTFSSYQPMIGEQ